MCMFGDLSIEDFFFRVNAEMALVQFYKDIIESLWTLDNWSSPYALWFDELELSVSEQIEIYQVQVTPLTDDYTLYGRRDYAADCIPGDFAGTYDYLGNTL